MSDSEEIALIEAILRDWRQGDAMLGPDAVLVHLADKRLPLTAASRSAAADAVEDHDIFEVLTPVLGLVVVTQSCDIVKPCAKSEFVEVSPLVQPVSDQDFSDIQKSRISRYAYLPGLASRKLVVDLDRTMTVEKAVVAGWKRIPGCTNDDERVAFAEALARKRQRFAFPDGFNTGLRRFRDRIRDKAGKATPEGRLIEAIDHVRVQAVPNWDGAGVRVFFWFLLKSGEDIDFDASRLVIQNWMGRVALTSVARQLG